MTTFMGIDPGMVRFGVGSVIREDDKITLGKFAVINHPLSDATSFNEHLDDGIAQIAQDFPKLLQIIAPDLIVYEFVPPGKLGSNNQTVNAALVTAKVIANQWGIPFKGLGANTIKKNLTGDGTATKARVRNAVLALYPEIEPQHQKLKEQQKANGEKREGLPQDVFDGIAAAYIGSIKFYDDTNKGSKA